jgi:hypothetical protein
VIQAQSADLLIFGARALTFRNAIRHEEDGDCGMNYPRHSVSEFVLERGGSEHHGVENCQNYPKAILAQIYALPHVHFESAREGYISCPSSAHTAVLPYKERQTRRKQNQKPNYRVHRSPSR